MERNYDGSFSVKIQEEALEFCGADAPTEQQATGTHQVSRRQGLEITGRFPENC